MHIYVYIQGIIIIIIVSVEWLQLNPGFLSYVLVLIWSPFSGRNRPMNSLEKVCNYQIALCACWDIEEILDKSIDSFAVPVLQYRYFSVDTLVSILWYRNLNIDTPASQLLFPDKSKNSIVSPISSAFFCEKFFRLTNRKILLNSRFFFPKFVNCQLF